jgi:hypothetical protein
VTVGLIVGTLAAAACGDVAEEEPVPEWARLCVVPFAAAPPVDQRQPSSAVASPAAVDLVRVADNDCMTWQDSPGPNRPAWFYMLASRRGPAVGDRLPASAGTSQAPDTDTGVFPPEGGFGTWGSGG